MEMRARSKSNDGETKKLHIKSIFGLECQQTMTNYTQKKIKFISATNNKIFRVKLKKKQPITMHKHIM